MAWIEDPEKLKLVNMIRETDIIRSLYKLLLYIYLGIERTGDIKLLLGGNYYALLREAELRGYVKRELGRVYLTEEGGRLAAALLECLQGLREKKERKG